MVETGDKKIGRNVFNHCQIVGWVARKLIESLPNSLREQLFPIGSELLAAVHDLGKVSPTFFLSFKEQQGILALRHTLVLALS